LATAPEAENIAMNKLVKNNVDKKEQEQRGDNDYRIDRLP
jgi:hypothetical protein